MKSNVLVVPAGTEIGLEISESLSSSKHWRLIGANSVRDHSDIAYHDLVLDLPFANDDRFVDEVRRVSAEVGADFVIPAHDDAIYALAGQDLGGAKFVGPARSLANILRFKSTTYAALNGHVACPAIVDPNTLQLDNLPVFAKPDRGQGSRGARKIATQLELSDLQRAPMGLVVTEYLPGPEFTVDCFTDRRGRLAYASARARVRTSNGISVRTQGVDNPRLAEMAGRIGSTLGLRGAWFFQAMADRHGELRLIEVANRVAGTMGFQRERGVNLIEAWLHDLNDRDVSFIPWRFGPVIVERALSSRAMWEYRPDTAYVDFDDTLVLPNGKLNYRLVGLLYGLKANLGVRLVLITRHRLAIQPSLKKFGLEQLFDEVHHLASGEPKSSVIGEGPAIFVDDSFAERLEVWTAKGIPTFPVEAVACIEGLNRVALGDP